MIDTSALKFALCRQCPGGMKIHPPSLLKAHKAKYHPSGGLSGPASDTIRCISCGKDFVISVPSRRCPKCRRNRVRHKPPGIRRKQMVASGKEKDVNIAQRHGVMR